MGRYSPWRTTRRDMALHQSSRNDWYRIRNQNGGPTQLHIYDEIGYFGVSAMDLVRDLADVSGPLEVHLNSPGGEVYDGIAIYNALVARSDVTIMIDGLAASIASVIAMAGNPVLIARQGTMMMHDGFTMAIGNAQDLRDAAEQIERASHNIASIYSEHTGKPVSYWRELMKAETWFTGEEAIDAGLADRFIDSGAGRQVAPPSDSWDLGVFRAGHRPPPSDNPGPTGEEFEVKFADGSVVKLNWDAAAAMGKCHSAADFRSIAFERSNDSDPDTQAHWALPHHASPGAGPDRGGVIAALGRINQTNDLKNKSAAASHLHAHASSLGLPSGDKHEEPKPPEPNLDGWTDEDYNKFLDALKGA